MANFKEINKTIKEITGMDIEAVRGDGYIYFNGDDGFDKIASICVHPPTTSTATATRLCLEEIREVYEEGDSK